MTFPLEWYLLFLISIPQTILVTMMGLSLFNIKLTWKKQLIIAIVSGTFTYFIRFIPMVFGIHTLISIIVITLITSAVGRVKLLYALCAMIAGVMVIALIESCILPLFFHFTSITIESIKSNPWHNVIVFVPELIIIIGLYILIRVSKFRMWDLHDVI